MTVELLFEMSKTQRRKDAKTQRRKDAKTLTFSEKLSRKKSARLHQWARHFCGRHLLPPCSKKPPCTNWSIEIRSTYNGDFKEKSLHSAQSKK